MGRPIVFFDIETSGLGPAAEIIQLSAIAVDRDTWEPLIPSFNKLLTFDLERAESKALELNHYDEERWKREAESPTSVLKSFGDYLRAWATIPMTSKGGRPYYLAQLAGYNTEAFDAPRLRDAFKAAGLFYPAHYRTLDVMQLAAWVEMRKGELCPSLRLGEICYRYGIDGEGAHDALADVRMTIALAKALLDWRPE
jgi:DNA polymerase III epsilon subunit-like protein